MMEHALIAVVGPTGHGKGAVMKAVLERFTGELGHYRSVTTRPPRPGETNKDYEFISQPEFDLRVSQGELIEWVSVFNRSYGRAKAPLEELRRRPMIGDMTEDGIDTFEGYARETGAFVLRVVRVQGQNMAPLARRDERAAADAERARRLTRVDLELLNDHAPGGLERAVSELEQYIRTSSRVIAP